MSKLMMTLKVIKRRVQEYTLAKEGEELCTRQ